MKNINKFIFSSIALFTLSGCATSYEELERKNDSQSQEISDLKLELRLNTQLIELANEQKSHRQSYLALSKELQRLREETMNLNTKVREQDDLIVRNEFYISRLKTPQVKTKPKNKNHLVEPGDTLSDISHLYKVSVNELLRLNVDIENKNLIFVGQNIKLK
ncbi:LysM domain-containing protein [uncultured Vibrio sp.]|uniref:LysM peptidoglycan-binding domain-containing protein n=1 Tax=uncultured Vibrio sp. TaxID=114054 RepID=UPI00261D80B5|nr:LysM domain-containing protein [uncultured Vibrio sp.]